MFCIMLCCLQVVPSLTYTPASTVTAQGQTIGYTISTVSGLSASTAYTYRLQKRLGTTPEACASAGTSSAAGVLASLNSPTISYSTTASDPYISMVCIYPVNACADTAASASAAPVACGTAQIRVSSWATCLA